MNHFARMCRSRGTAKQFREVAEVSSDLHGTAEVAGMSETLSDLHGTTEVAGVRDEDYIFIGECISNFVYNDQWKVLIGVCNTSIDFKVGTGADVSVIKYESYLKLAPKPKLLPSKKSTNDSSRSIKVSWYFYCSSEI